MPAGFEWLGVSELEGGMARGEFTSADVVESLLERIAAIDHGGPALRSVVELNPDARKIAAKLDRDRRTGRWRGPLHGVPVLLKENIETADRMETTAGSLALLGVPVARDATVAARLRMAGAVILGKTNLSEWANFRSTRPTSGWSARGGLTRNPHVLDHSASGSSSGSAVAVAAGLAPAAIGTETDGSILSPASVCGVVGLKPTVGLVSRAGIIPISWSQDTAGPMGRTVADCAALLGALTGPDGRDDACENSRGKLKRDYARFLKPGALKGARIGALRRPYDGYDAATDAAYEAALGVLREAGAVVIDPAREMTPAEGEGLLHDELAVLLYEFRRGLDAYLAERCADGPGPRTLADIVEFNDRNAERELAHFGQELFHQALSQQLSETEYAEKLARIRHETGAVGIDAPMDAHRLDALVAPSCNAAWPTGPGIRDRFLGGVFPLAAMCGYPAITVPMGWDGPLPLGLAFIGRPWSEPTLLRLAHGFEEATHWRREPQFLESM